MFDFSFYTVTVKDCRVTLLILAGSMCGFVSERLTPGVTALLPAFGSTLKKHFGH